MKSTTYISNILALGLGTVGIISVSAQDDLEDERSSVCGFTLQANGADVFRTNDWKLSNSNYGGRLTRAQFYITDANNGRLYGGGGDRCGFDRMFLLHKPIQALVLTRPSSLSNLRR